mmetsp:Transcript_62305/g.179203  ORF Transcript_62305/g.179203 Transcript_62305/m.179203 type:complete len:456 (+) Transcript_62305:150-1517(+)
MSAAEQKVKKLARLPSNCICPNCGTHKQFGFSTVCIKFHTFVCNHCKSSHQAISHRCKSLTMSSWTDAEAAELEAKGNDYARRTWLKNAPPVGTNRRPKEGDSIDVFKQFVVDAYEHRKYYGEDTGAVTAPAPQGVAAAVPVAQAPPPTRRPIQQPRNRPPAPAPAPAAADLLDFSASTPAPAPASFQADFDAFASSAPAPADGGSSFGFISGTPAAAPAPSPAPASSNTGSSFGFISSPPAAAPAQPPASAPSQSGFGFISKPPAAPSAPAPSGNDDFASFAGMSISSSPAPAPMPMGQKKPVMSSSSQKGSLISSSMGTMPSGSTQQGMNFGQSMQGGFGGGGNMSNSGFGNGMMGMNNNNMSQQQQMMMMQQQQQMRMQQQGIQMSNNMMGSMPMNNNMMGGGGMGIGMMTPQQMMNFGGQQQPGGKSKNADTMSSLSMSGMDVTAWTTGKK